MGRSPILPAAVTMPPLNRRAMLALVAAVPIFGAVAGDGAAATMDQSILRAVVDTMLPGDGDAPSGSNLGVDAQLRHLADGIPNYATLLALGSGWLDAQAHRQAGRSFTALSSAGRDGLLRAALAEPDQTMPRVYVTRLRSDAMTLYYAHPAAWRGLALDAPIQPAGYPDHHRAPPRHG
ncbi:gluconate 2-dehydrogenase subunit 3 family protein [Jannaschia sp. LMIT008]|uniref:gluconate 2-dehydrogenase subunit 3 family protein n=1 Tax=Jannaschia maritima TaxID=3032585 RepID=UPI00281125E1|nr:gluconate 2-dehydrogenase subunit 3 family protein [Jannaschia sp. LMIT008]